MAMMKWNVEQKPMLGNNERKRSEKLSFLFCVEYAAASFGAQRDFLERDSENRRESDGLFHSFRGLCGHFVLNFTIFRVFEKKIDCICDFSE